MRYKTSMAHKNHTLSSRIDTMVLAVLRAAVEGVPIGHYFGTTFAPTRWVNSAVNAGLLEPPDDYDLLDHGVPTALGTWLYQEIGLQDGQWGRAYGWPVAATA